MRGTGDWRLGPPPPRKKGDDSHFMDDEDESSIKLHLNQAKPVTAAKGRIFLPFFHFANGSVRRRSTLQKGRKKEKKD